MFCDVIDILFAVVSKILINLYPSIDKHFFFLKIYLSSIMFFNKSRNIDNIGVPSEFVEISSLLKLHAKEIKKKMLSLIHSNFNEDCEESQKQIMDILEYSVFLDIDYRRSFFVSILGEALEINKKNTMFIGAIIEMLNSYALIQNAMPEMENDDYINKTASCHKKFGKAQTAIALSALFSLITDSITDSAMVKMSDTDRCKLINVISKFSGKDGLNGGQMMKVICKKNNKCSNDTLIRIKKLNINSLFEAGAGCLAVVSKMTNKQKLSVKTYINNLCNIMNIYDEIKDDNNDGNELLKRSELLMKQGIQSVENITENRTKLVAFIKYCNYCIQRHVENNKTSKPHVVTGDTQQL